MQEYEIILDIYYIKDSAELEWDTMQVKVKIKAASKQEALEAAAESEIEPRGLK